MSARQDQSWRRQAAAFAAVASAFIGLGFAIVLLVTWRDARAPKNQPTPTPTPAAEMQNPKNH